MVKCKLVLDESVLSTLHRGGEGQNVYRMFFSNPCDQGCLRGEMISTLIRLTNHSDIWVKWRSCHQRWRQDDVSKFHGAALMWHIRYAGFLKLITVVWNAIFARTQQVHVRIVPCSLLKNRRAEHRPVITLRDGFLTDYRPKWRHNDVTTRSLNHFNDDIQLSTQNDTIFQRIALIVT